MSSGLRRFVAKRLLRESTQPQRNVDAFLEDVNAHKEAARLAVLFNTELTTSHIASRLTYGPIYIIEVPCMVSFSKRHRRL